MANEVKDILAENGIRLSNRLIMLILVAMLAGGVVNWYIYDKMDNKLGLISEQNHQALEAQGKILSSMVTAIEINAEKMNHNDEDCHKAFQRAMREIKRTNVRIDKLVESLNEG